MAHNKQYGWLRVAGWAVVKLKVGPSRNTSGWTKGSAICGTQEFSNILYVDSDLPLAGKTRRHAISYTCDICGECEVRTTGQKCLKTTTGHILRFNDLVEPAADGTISIKFVLLVGAVFC